LSGLTVSRLDSICGVSGYHRFDAASETLKLPLMLEKEGKKKPHKWGFFVSMHAY